MYQSILNIYLIQAIQTTRWIDLQHFDIEITWLLVGTL